MSAGRFIYPLNENTGYNISVPPNGSALFPLYIAETSYEARFEVSGFVDKSQSFSYGTAVFHVEALNGTANPVTWAGTPVQSVPVQPGLIDPEAFSFTTILSATVISTEGLALNTPLSNTVPSTSSSIQSSAIQSTVDLE
ncbi:MAG: hypothetical protein MMC33_003321 [Icmadophila ericetorum]|nr:hypothetical protein [Icmadophila ericetorum]